MALREYQQFVHDIAAAIARQLGGGRGTRDRAKPSGQVAAIPSLDTYCLDEEKFVWHYPDTTARLSEELP